MNMPFDVEQRFSWRRDQLEREAAIERLASQARGPSVSVRARLADWLYALAAWIGPHTAEPARDGRLRTARANGACD